MAKRRRRRRSNPTPTVSFNAKDVLNQIRKSHDQSKEVMNESSKETYSQWGISDGSKFYPTFPTTNRLDSGYYELNHSQQTGIFLQRKSVSTDELFSLPSTELQDILVDIEKFWERVDKYKEYNFIHKRGILLYGRPGCGKSAIIQLCTQHLIEEKDGIVINITNMDQMDWYNRIIGDLRQVEPERPLIVIMEDLDGLASEGSWATSMILNLLDGIKQIDNVVYIATTNHPEKLEERITNRPSRFDRRYEVELPNEEVRRTYFEKKLTDEDLESIDLTEWVDRTHGMSLSHLRELVISVITMDNTFEETMERLDGMKRAPKVESGRAKAGFGV